MSDRRYQPWTELEDEILTKHYTSGTMKSGEIANILGRTLPSVRARAVRLGLVYNNLKDIPEGYSKCSKCRGIFPFSAFSKNSKMANGIHGVCKVCARKDQIEKKAKYEEHREKYGAPTVLKCAGCGNVKPVSEFWKSSYSSTGYCSRCKICSKLQTQLRNTKKE